MKIICSREDLLKGMNISMKAVPSHTTMDILQCVLIDASTSSVHLITNDMEMGIETIIDGTILEKGAVALDARIFNEIIRRLPDSEVTIFSDSGFITLITCEKAKFTIPGKSGEGFSTLPVVEKNEPLTISQFSLKEMIRQTIFSIASNENNKIMTGELFEIKDRILSLVSLDGHRISIRRLMLERDYENQKVIVPGKTLNEISKILSGEMDEIVSIFFTENHIIFEMEDTTIVSRLIEGEYFRIDQMLSSDYETKILVNKKRFMECIDRSSLLVKEGDKKPLIIRVRDNEMELFMDTQMGTMNEEVDIEKEGKDIIIGFNPKFLIDALRSVNEEDVTLYMTNAKAPCYIRDNDLTYTYLILPVNINQSNYV